MDDWMKIALALALCSYDADADTVRHAVILIFIDILTTEAVDITEKTWQLNTENNQNRRLHRIPSARLNLRGNTSVV